PCRMMPGVPSRSPESRMGGIRPSVYPSNREISTCVSLRAGPRMRTRLMRPFGPIRSTVSRQAYCPGCDRSLSLVKAFGEPNNRSIAFGDKCTCRLETPMGISSSACSRSLSRSFSSSTIACPIHSASLFSSILPASVRIAFQQGFGRKMIGDQDVRVPSPQSAEYGIDFPGSARHQNRLFFFAELGQVDADRSPVQFLAAQVAVDVNVPGTDVPDRAGVNQLQILFGEIVRPDQDGIGIRNTDGHHGDVGAFPHFQNPANMTV